MKQVINFFKPSINKILLAVFLWLALWLIDMLFFSICILGDCMKNGQAISCCGGIRTEIASFIYQVKIFYPLVAYLISCIFFANRKIAKVGQ